MRISESVFTVFDVETTGLYPYKGDMICEIAAVKFSPGSGQPEIFQSLVDPKRPISSGAFFVNKITQDMLIGKPTIDRILPDFLRFIEGSILVAYNAGFDIGFIESALGRDKDVISGYRVIDVLRLARRLFPGLPRYSLKDVTSSLGIERLSAHRALNDVCMTKGVFDKSLDELGSNGIDEIEDLIAFFDRKDLPAMIVKHYDMDTIDKAVGEQERIIALEDRG